MRLARRNVALGLLASLALVVTCVPPALALASAPAGPSGASGAAWRQVFSDDFHSSSLDTSRWGTCYPWDGSSGTGCTNYGNAEQEWYLPGQDQVGPQGLQLIAQKVPTPGTSSLGQPETYPWRSGMATTYPSFSFKYGFVQVSAEIPAGARLWPAIWLLPSNFSWPPEIDVMEAYGADPYVAYVTAIYRTVGGLRQQFHRRVETPNLASGFHTFGLDWEPQSLTWYLDGHAVASLKNVKVSTTPMYLILNLAVAGSPALGTPPSTPQSASFNIRSVTIWQHGVPSGTGGGLRAKLLGAAP